MEKNKSLTSLEEENKRLSECLYEINSFFERHVLHDIDPYCNEHFRTMMMANKVLRHLFDSFGLQWIEIDEINYRECGGGAENERED